MRFLEVRSRVHEVPLYAGRAPQIQESLANEDTRLPVARGVSFKIWGTPEFDRSVSLTDKVRRQITCRASHVFRFTLQNPLSVLEWCP